MFLSVFCYLLFFWSMSQAGNGGEYWGFDGHIDPVRAADEYFEANDYRFLELDLRDSLDREFTGTPAVLACEIGELLLMMRLCLASVLQQNSCCNYNQHVGYAYQFIDDRQKEKIWNS